MTTKPHAPGVMGIMAASLAEQRAKATESTKVRLERVFADDEDLEPVTAPAPVVSEPEPAPPPPSKPRLNGLERSEDIVVLLDPNLIDPWKYADRPDDEFGELEELTESIRAHGQETPALVRPSSVKGRYELIYGRRRWTVCKDLGMKLKAVIKDLDNATAYQKMHLENKLRTDLSAWAKARSYKQVLEDGLYISESALAAHLGIHRSSLSNIMCLTRIPSEIVEAVGSDGMRNMGVQTAKTILSLAKAPENIEKIVSLSDKIAAGNMGAEALTKAVQSANKPRERDTRVIADDTGRKLFSLRQTGRNMTEVMFYPEALKRYSEEELISKIKGLFCE